MKTKKLVCLILSVCILTTLFVIPQVSAATPYITGKCGDNLTWAFYLTENKLTITGSGDMYSYTTTDTVWSGGTSKIWVGVPPTILRHVELGDGVTSIGNNAFAGLSYLETVTMADSVTSIGEWAFRDCKKLESINISKNVTSISDYAFSGCKILKKINISDLSSWCKISMGNSESSPAKTSKGTLYINDTPITTLIIPNTVTEIKQEVFYGFSNIFEVTIPSSVKKIGKRAFADCSSLKTVDLSEGLETIGFCAFGICPTLTEICIPKSVTSIENNAFIKPTGSSNTHLCVYPNSVGLKYAQENSYPYTLIQNKDFTGLTFENGTYNYDGTEKILYISGNLPEGATVNYTNNKGRNAGTYNATATVSCKGYNDLALNATLKINPAELSITANNKQMKKGGTIPTLDYTKKGDLFGNDTITGKLAVNTDGKTVGNFDIKQGTLTAGSNYKINFTKGVLSVVDKDAQKVEISAISDKTYGDNDFKISVTKDDASSLGKFTFESSNPLVAEIDNTGNITIKNTGKTSIVVKRAGNENYADFEKSQNLVVNKVAITVTADAQSKRIGTKDPTLTYSYTGNLIGTDTFTGGLVRQSGEAIGKYDILQGTLDINDNYNITYNKAIFEIVDKTPQNVGVEGIVAEKTYGDDGFKITVTPDENSNLDNFEITSSNTNVATIDDEGNVTIKNAGSTTISVKEPGNADYAPFEKTWTLTVNKVDITVTADNKFKKIGQADPEFTYTYTGELVGSDEFTGTLTRKTGEAVGKYDILIGSLALTDNYTITYNKGVFEILDKTPQIIALADIDAKTYGDASFKVTATADTTSKLDVFTYESDNTNVATVDAEGNVTIIGVGKANIIVKQAGNDEYAAASASKELVVNKKNITLTDVDLTNKTATFEGVLETDISAVGIDFDKIDSVVNSETSKAVVSNFVLIGDKSANYALTTKEIEKDVVISAGTITAPENVTITVQKAEGTKTVIVSTLDVSALPEETEKVELDMTENGSVDTVSVPKTAFTDLKDKADLEIKLTDGVVKLNKLALTAIEDAANSDKISLKVVKLGDEQLEEVQVTEKNKLTNPVVFGLILSGVTDSLFDGGQATVTVSYEKTGSGNVKVKYLKDDGTTEAVSSRYDATNKTVTMTLSHFSDYVVYTEPQTYSGGGGGGVSSYTVKFDTNGAETIKNQSIKKNGLVTEPTMPTKDGYTFDGWYTDKELTQKYDFTTKVTKGFTLYAKWTEIEKEPVVDEPDTTITFTDVKENDWFYANVQYVVENKLMNGVAEDKFAPNDTLTRAMLVTVLYRNAGEPAVNKSIPFADVDMGSWYANAVVWAKQNGIVNGVNDTDFAPDANITREQIATIMFRYAQYKGMEAVTLEENLHFTDANEISEYAVSAMNWAVGTGLMNGKSATTLNPKDNATRAEIAAILQRFIEANK